MSWLKTVLKSGKSALIAGGACTTINPEEIVTNTLIALISAGVTAVFDWYKHRKD